MDSQARVCPVGPWQRTGPEGPPGTTVTSAVQDIPRQQREALAGMPASVHVNLMENDDLGLRLG